MKLPFKTEKKELPEFWNVYQSEFEKKQSADLDAVRFVVLDTETTGFDYQRDRILSIGAIALSKGSIFVSEALEIYLSQDRYDKNTVKVHGILKNESMPCLAELQALKALLGYLKNSVIVGHHTQFDINMINKALKRNQLPKLLNSSLDTAFLYPKTLIASPLRTKKEQYTLDDLAEAYDISKKDRHTALGDAYITAIAFLKILNRLPNKEKLSLASLLKMG